MTPLCALAFKYGTDKAGSYTALYDTLLRDRRDKVKNVLEIGIGSREAMRHVPGYEPGASLRMWRDYFPNAHIFGIDNDPAVMFHDLGITTVECSQHSAAGLKAVTKLFGSSFDLIVDDGDHTVEGQLISANTLVPFLAPGGLYVIEDTHKPEELSAQLRFEHAVVSYKYTPALTGRLILIRG